MEIFKKNSHDLWEDHLRSLETRGLIDPKTISSIKEIWGILSKGLNRIDVKTSAPMQPPHFATSDFVCEMSWDVGEYHLSIEIENDVFAWLFRDRETDQYSGGEVLTVAELITKINPYLPHFI